jgi:hypothetical protein
VRASVVYCFCHEAGLDLQEQHATSFVSDLQGVWQAAHDGGQPMRLAVERQWQ